VPVFFLLGRSDYNTPSLLAADYLKRLESPIKAEMWFEESAHFPFWEEPAAFHEALVWIDTTVRNGN
jgi:pimeloyl-ACP methyl ester carboxylesterase